MKKTRNLENRILSVEKKIQKNQKIDTSTGRGRARLRSRGQRGMNAGFNPGQTQGQRLNSQQLTSVNPNVYWEFSKGTSPGGLRVKAREPIGSLVLSADTTGAFTQCDWASVSGPYMNFNTDNDAFPRLSNISLAFEYFKFHSARLDFISTQPTTAAGQILLWADYNAVDALATSASEALSNVSSVIANVYSTCSIMLLSNLSRLPRYVCNINTSGANDNQTVQMIAYGAVQGFSGSTGDAIGLVMVEYDVEFFTPAQQNGAVLRSPEKVFRSIREEFQGIDSECSEQFWKTVCQCMRKTYPRHTIKFLDDPSGYKRGTLKRETSAKGDYLKTCGGKDGTSCTRSVNKD